MSPSRILTALTRNRAQTHPRHPDPTLRGRTYAIPFAKVWAEAVALASGELRGWTLLEADEELGTLRAESRTLLFKFVDDVGLRISLDENALTRVDMTSASRRGRGDLGTNARRIRRFFGILDQRVGAGPGTVLDPTLSPPPWFCWPSSWQQDALGERPQEPARAPRASSLPNPPETSRAGATKGISCS